MIKSYVLFPIKVTSQPQRLLNLQTLLPQVCMPFFCLFVCLFLFSPRKNNTYQHTCKRVSSIAEWLTSYISSAPPVAFVVKPSYRFFQMMNVLLLTHCKDLWSKLGFQSLIYLTFYPSYALGEDAWMQQISKLKNAFLIETLKRL